MKTWTGSRDRRRDRIQRDADHAGPDQRILHDREQHARQSGVGWRGVAHQHRDAEHVEHRRHRHHRDRGEREAEIAKQVAGERQRHEGLPARRALEQRREGRAVGAEVARQQRAGARSTAPPSASTVANSVPPTASTGTLVRSARTIVPISRAGNIT